MTLDKIIYLSSLVGRAQIVVCCLLGALVFIALMYLIMGACEYSYGDRSDYYFKNVKKYAKLSLAVAILAIAIPSRWEVLSMTVTKGYHMEDIYKMTKDELRDNIDYLIHSLEKMEKMKND